MAVSDKTGVKARLEVIAEALEIPSSEVARAMSCDDEMVAFAKRHEQSLDYIWLADIKPMLRMLRSRPVAPAQT